MTTSRWPESAPKAEIILRSTTYQPYELIFLQSDGSNDHLLKVPENFVKPVWSSNGKRSFGLSNPDWMPPYEEIGYPAYCDIDDHRFDRCNDDMIYFKHLEEYYNSDNFNEVILYDENKKEFIVFNIDTRQRAQQLGEITDKSGTVSINGFGYSPKTHELTYGEVFDPCAAQRDYRSIKLNLKTGEKAKLAKGINPA